MTDISPSTRPSPGTVLAVLGPTNTGKTHYAIERMLGHDSGVIGLPLRLLAREVYDKVIALRGVGQAALVTGEEKIVPANPRYWVCTVESMPTGLMPEFLAVDEIQLAADPERGHVFNDRLLHARGKNETLFLGAQTMRPVIQALLPEAKFLTRERFSKLSWTGSKKISRLPRRAAIVTFSINEVYAIAELIRRQRGGVAVVMGALSPRTRNAQVALYESGEVDFMIATDAIGMGLNLDLGHVAFASTEKFDGRAHRALKASELSQIAGRAGRHANDGTFGVTGQAGLLDPEIIKRIEDHEFLPVCRLFWRNSNLDFRNLDALLASLERPSDNPALSRTRDSDDLLVLKYLADCAPVLKVATNPEQVRRLWDVAQIPDFAKTMSGDHPALLERIFLHLSAVDGVLPDDWIAGQVDRFDRTDGDIDTLSSRLAHIRTWTYVSNRPGWLADPPQWQGRTRTIEDRLSDALHEALIQRFIDRRTSVLMKRLHQKEVLMAEISEDGQVTVEGQIVGRIKGFRFVADPSATAIEGKALRAAAGQVLDDTLTARAKALMADEAKAITISEQGALIWREEPVATLTKGAGVLAPRVQLLADEHMPPATREKLLEHLQIWVFTHLRGQLSPLYQLRDSIGLQGIAKGVAFRIVEGLGVVERDAIARELKELDQDTRASLRALAVRFAEYSVYVPTMLKPAPARLKLILWTVYNEVGEVPDPPQPGLVTIAADDSVPDGYYPLTGFRRCGPVAIRIDMVERIADALRELIKRSNENPKGEFVVNPDLMSLAGRSGDDFSEILKSLGYRQRSEEGEVGQITVFWSRKPPKRTAPRKPPAREASPGNGAGRKQKKTRKPKKPAPTPRAGAGRKQKKPRKLKKAAPPPRAVKVDSSSPFAALADLKARMGADKSKS